MAQPSPTGPTLASSQAAPQTVATNASIAAGSRQHSFAKRRTAEPPRSRMGEPAGCCLESMSSLTLLAPDLELREPPAAVAPAQAIGMHSHRLAGRHARRMDGRALRAIVAVDFQGARPRVTRWQLLVICERVPGSRLHLGSVSCSVVGWACAARARAGAGPQPAQAGRPGSRAGSRPGRPAPEPAVRSTRQPPHGRAVRPQGRWFGPAGRGALWRNR